MKPISYLFILISFCSSSCYQKYYLTNSATRIDSAGITGLLMKEKYFILHTDQEEYSMHYMKVGNDSLDARLLVLADNHSDYLEPKYATHSRYKVKDKELVLNEVHLYTRDTFALNDRIHIPLKDFSRMNVYSNDKTKNTEIAVLSTIGVVVVSVSTLFLVAFAANGFSIF